MIKENYYLKILLRKQNYKLETIKRTAINKFMDDLLKKKCACEGGVIIFDISEIHKYQKKVDGWEIAKII